MGEGFFGMFEPETPHLIFVGNISGAAWFYRKEFCNGVSRIDVKQTIFEYGATGAGVVLVRKCQTGFQLAVHMPKPL